MNRAAAEQVIRDQLSRVVANALTAGVPSAGMMNRATEKILEVTGWRCETPGDDGMCKHPGCPNFGGVWRDCPAPAGLMAP